MHKSLIQPTTTSIWIARISGAFAFSLGALGLSGWIFGVDQLKSIFPGLATMKANTAIGIILTDLALIVGAKKYPSPPIRRLSWICAISAGILGTVTLFEYILNINIGIDQFFFVDTASVLFPGRMSHATAFCFILSAAAIIFMLADYPNLSQILAMALGSISIFAISGYLYGIQDLYAIRPFSTMAIHTTLGFVFLSIGIICARSNEGLVAPFFSDRPGGRMARFLWLPIVIFTVGVGGLTEKGEAMGFIGGRLDTAILVVFVVALATIGILLNARSMNHAEEKSRLALDRGLRLEAKHKEIQGLRAALDEHAIVAVTDAHGKIIYANDKFCSLSKYDQEELLGKDHRIINSGYHPPEFFKNLWATIKSGHVWKGEIKNRAKDGSFYWVDTTIVPFLDEHRNPTQFIAIRTDITANKKINEILQKQKDELAQSNADLEQFAYAASHDLQEPLRSVASCLQLLETKYTHTLEDDGKKLIAHSVTGAFRMKKLVEGILDYSQITARETSFVPVDLNQAVKKAIENLNQVIDESKAKISVDPLPTINGDISQLTRLFQNLISNAVKFCKDKSPVIHIDGQKVSSEWIISIQDNGIGIDPKYLDHIFVLFKKLHSPFEYRGTGIGLSLCKKIVERHGGRIWAQQAGGGGSIFRMAFPE